MAMCVILYVLNKSSSDSLLEPVLIQMRVVLLVPGNALALAFMELKFNIPLKDFNSKVM